MKSRNAAVRVQKNPQKGEHEMTVYTKEGVYMRLQIIVLCVVLAAGMSACGSSSKSTNATYTVYRNYSSYSSAVNGSLLGGSIQKGPFSGKLHNYTTYNPAFTRFSSPVALALDGSGSLYVAAYDSHSIFRVDLGANTVTRFSGGGASGSQYGFQNSTTAHAALYYRPAALTSDGSYLYVADSFNRVIRKIDLGSNQVTLLAGQHGISGTRDGAATDATFNLLTGITVVGTNLFAVDSGSETIRMLDMVQNTVTTFAGAPGSPGASDGVGRTARFNQPARIASDGLYLYVTDFGNKTVRRITLLTGEVRTIAGSASVAGTSDGKKALFRGPNGIATDGVHVYVTDFPAVTANDGSTNTQGAIRKITLSNFSTATILTGLNTPMGVSVGSSSLYVSDKGTRSIIRIK